MNLEKMEIEENTEFEFHTPQRRPENKDLEVTGISRSGRVRKKSSKLVDFESSKNIVIESKPKRTKSQSSPHDRSKKQKLHKEKHSSSKNLLEKQKSNLSLVEQTKVKTESSSDYDMQTSDSEFEQEPASHKNTMQSPEYTSDDSGNHDTEMSNNHVSQTKSSHTPEQYIRKLVIDVKAKDKSKSRRKDKGKTRFTAYMLWSKEMRQEIVKKNPHMDFTSISKRLGELWSAVPSSEKYNWTKRAKRLAATSVPTVSNKQFINKSGPNKETEAETFKSPQKVGTSSKTKNLPSMPVPAETRSVKELIADSLKGATLTRVIDTQPIDVAAYLKLLGESLTLIGERLKEHNGQIAVSGSLSVLLDSLLCALGSLTCLTQQIPVIGNANTETLTKTLENIAYIMPGL